MRLRMNKEISDNVMNIEVSERECPKWQSKLTTREESKNL